MTTHDQHYPAFNPYAPPAQCAPTAATYAEEHNATSGPRGIAGWLLLPVLQLVVMFASSSYALLNTYAPLFAPGGAWWLVTNPAVESYHPLWGPLLVFEIIITAASVVAAAVGLVLMFRRAAVFPRLMIGIYLTSFGYTVVDYFFASFIPSIAASPDAEAMAQIGRAFIGCLIWVSYFRASKRVANTFTRCEQAFGEVI